MKKRTLLPVVAAMSVAAVALVASSQDEHQFKISKNLDIFFSIFKNLDLYYVDEPDPDRLVPDAIDAMLGGLDPYTTYIPEKDKDEYNFMIEGQYGGVGAIIQKSDTNLIQVREIYAGTPSQKAGLKPGDRFVMIDGESMRGKDVAQVRSKLRGKVGETIEVVIERPGVAKNFSVDIKRELVKLDAVEYYGMVDDEIGYILLRSFETDCAEAVKKAFLDLRDKKGAKSVILDLRGNTGGLLDESLQIVNFFVPQGSRMLQTKGRRKAMDRVYTAQRQPVDTVMPLAVMINRGSASASEIVSGALQDLDRAVVTGQRSFGKGLVQATREVAYDGMLKLTTAKYYTPSGRCIQAIDYSHRDESGAVGYVPDSLISEFHTRGGRPVYDGGGISPDVLLDIKSYKPVTVALIYTDQVFSFIVDLTKRGLKPQLDNDGKVTDALFNDFMAFVKTRPGFKYRTASQDAYDKLVSAAKSDGVYEARKSEFDALKATCQADLERDMNMAKVEISRLMEEEIIRFYSLRKASIGHNLQYDEQLAETCRLLHDGERFRGLLSGSVPSHAGDKRAASNSK